MSNDSVVLTVRGTLSPKTLEAARALHNETAGSPPGIAAARALGDLSHKVYTPVTHKLSGAKEGELLFIDVWEDAGGIQKFFSNTHVQEQGSRLFVNKRPTVWMRARGAFTFQLPASSSRNERYVGMIRGTIASPDQAIETFRGNVQKNLRAARERGQLSHELFIKLGPPNEAVELLGINLWCDAAGMAQHYQDTMMGFDKLFTGAPAASVWEQAKGDWSEW